MKKLTAILLGAGNRGLVYADYAISNPERLEITGVVETNKENREEAKRRYSLPDRAVFKCIDDFLKANIECDFVINATMDEAHYETTMKLIAAGYDILLEKPVTNNKKELLDIQRAANKKGVKIVVCHVLRYAPFYRTIKETINEGVIGKILTIEMNEHVWIAHFLDSFVRGKWSSEAECGSSFLLQKSCHDTDLICWLHNDSEPKRVSSFGSRSLFIKANAPAGATEYCYNCPHNSTCLYSAQKVHLEQDLMPFQTWMGMGKQIEEITKEEKAEYLKHSRYGKCAFNSGGDIVDRQTLNVEFEDGVTAVFTMVGGTSKAGRYLHIVGTHGEIEGHLESNEFALRVFDRSEDKYTYNEEIVNVADRVKNHSKYAGHGGGDYLLMSDTVDYIGEGKASVSVTDINDSVNGHCLVFAAEKARKQVAVIDFKEFKNEN